ncbi:MAG: ATP-binding protein [Bacillota bacterium]
MTNTLVRLTNLKQIEEVIGQLRLIFIEKGVPEEASFDIQLALMESINNAFLHGCRGIEEPFVEVEWFIKNNSIKMRVRDNGKGFDHSSAGSFDEINILEEKGKGLYLIFSILDNVWFNEAGNEILFEKKW